MITFKMLIHLKFNQLKFTKMNASKVVDVFYKPPNLSLVSSEIEFL